MLGHRFTELVEYCLQRLDQGEDLLKILADYPDYQERLKPLLLVAMASRAIPVPVPNQTAQRIGKSQLLEEMDQLEGQEAFRKSPKIPSPARWAGKLVGAVRSKGLTSPSPRFRLAAVALIMAFGTGFFTLNASASGFSGEMINYFLSGYNKVIQVLSFTPMGFDGPGFSPFQFFPGLRINFQNQAANKVVFSLDIEEEEDSFTPPPADQEGNKNQHKYGDQQGEMAGAGTGYPSENDPMSLTFGHDEDQDIHGLALGHDKDQDNHGLALGHDMYHENNGLALGHDKDQDNNGLALGHDKDLKEEIKEDKDKDKDLD